MGAYLSKTDLDHLRAYLPRGLVEALQVDLLSPSSDLLAECIASLGDLLDGICALLPVPLIEHVAIYPRPGEVGGQFMYGTLLFADISGFTTMSERFNRLGQEGAEEIIAVVNRYFGAMLAILREHDGQLVEFDGDALLGLFPEPNSATRATQSAQRMQAAMADFSATQTSQGSFALRIKIGLHKGRFFAARLGTAQRMVYSLFGSDVNVTAAIEDAAMAGQVLVDRETMRAVTAPIRVTPSPQNERYLVVEDIASPPELSRGPDTGSRIPFVAEPTLIGLRQMVDLLDALTPYLPVGLLPRFVSDARAARPEGEHRLVSVLFAGINGLDDIVDALGAGHEAEIINALNRYVLVAQSAVHRYGGVVNKMDLAPNGEKLLAFFGAPAAHEDDAERAVRSAIALQERLHSLRQELAGETGLVSLHLEQRVGISYGYVFAGNIGTDWRREYTVMGDEVNLAERLLAVAEPGGVAVSDSVWRRVQRTVDLAPQGDVLLKGKSEPVSTFAVRGILEERGSQRGLQGMRSPMVGRRVEWDRLMKVVDRLLKGQGQIVSLVGEVGLGKSRLVTELRGHVAGSTVQWLEGRCQPYTEPVSYWPFQDILRQMLNLGPDERDTEAWEKLRHALEDTSSLPDVSAVLPYVAGFLGLPVEAWLQERVRYLDAEALQRRTFIAIGILFEAYAKSRKAPLLVVLEDVHWIDQASTALLQHLLSLVDRTSLMFLLTYRPEQDSRSWKLHQEIEQQFPQSWSRIDLNPLRLTDSQELLGNLVDVEDWSSAMQDMILSRAEGNPLYLEELLRALVDDRILIQDEDGRWRLTERVGHLRVPDTLQGVIMTRLDRLEETSRWTAQVASVIGRAFSVDLLRRIVPMSESQLQANLSQLCEHEIIRNSERAPQHNYVFNHVLVQDVCYRSLLARTRRLYHRRIAECLVSDEIAGQEAGGSYPFVAYHAFVGQDWPRAFRYQLLAGEHARALFANEASIEHYRKVLQSAEHLSDEETEAGTTSATAALGELLTTTGQYEEAGLYLGRARTLAADRGDWETEARVCRWLARLHELRGEYTAGVEWIQQGLVVLEGRETVEMAHLLLTAGLINTRLGNYDTALDQCELSLRAAERLGEVAVLARGYTLLGHLCRLRGVGTVTTWYLQRGLDLYEIAGDINGQAITHDLIATALFHTGEWQEAEREYLQAREISDLIGNRYSVALADNNLGGIALNQGRLDEALDFYQGALHSLEQMGGSLYVQGALHMNLGYTYVRRGEVEPARYHLQTAESYFEQAQARDWLPEMHRHFAEAALLAGDLSEAQVNAERALELARELAMRNEEGNGLRLLAQVAIARGQLERAQHLLDEGIAILERVHDQYEWACSMLTLAELGCERGDAAQCSHALDQCTHIFDRLDAALEMQRVQELYERMGSRVPSGTDD